jgi:hypothetical protein
MRPLVCFCLLAPPACLGAWYAATLAAARLDHRGGGGHPPEAGLVVEGGPVAEVEHHSNTGPVEHVFRLTNRSSAPIEVERVEAGCSCSIAGEATGLIPPGETRDLRVTMVSLPIDVAVASQDFTAVLGDGGRLVLTLRVKLPPPRRSLFRPMALYFMPNEGETRITRTVGLRVPKHCGVKLTARNASKVNCDDLEVSVTEMPPTELYYEYQLTVVAPASAASRPNGASLRIATGCDEVNIPVYFMTP